MGQSLSRQIRPFAEPNAGDFVIFNSSESKGGGGCLSGRVEVKRAPCVSFIIEDESKRREVGKEEKE